MNGTVNDLAVSGAAPVALVTTFVLEAGLPTRCSTAEVRAMARAARAAGVAIVGGDTKVVEHGKTDRLYITTTGLGRPHAGRVARRRLGPRRATRCSCPARSAITASPSCSRAASSTSRPTSAPTPARCCRWSRRWPRRSGPGIRWMRDPTRGGVATSLNELALDCGLAVHLFEEAIPVRDEVRGACELLGLDPLPHRQ